MRKPKHSEVEIARALMEAQAGKRVDEICTEMNISSATFYNWKRLYSGLQESDLTRLRDLLDENRKLKSSISKLVQDREILQDVLAHRI